MAHVVECRPSNTRPRAQIPVLLKTTQQQKNLASTGVRNDSQRHGLIDAFQPEGIGIMVSTQEAGKPGSRGSVSKARKRWAGVDPRVCPIHPDSAG
jgi:hypothetical protein